MIKIMYHCRLNIHLHAVLKLLFLFASTSSARKYSPYVIELIERLPTEYCPFTKYCQSNATYNLQDEKQTACCDACSCDEDCWDRGTCCPDMKSDTTKPRTEFCRSPMVKRRKHQSYTLPRYGYYVVTNCPTTEKNGDLVQKCAGISQERYEDFVWVSDTATNKIYINKFCAECNGVKKYKDWYLSTDCSAILEGDYSFKDTKIVPARCSLSVIPPRRLDVPTNRCTLNVISECNQTGNWQTFDRGLVEACLAFEQQYFEVGFTSTEIYRNVFCYLCNQASGITIKNVCKRTDMSTRDAGPVFTTLFDHTFFKDREEPKEYPCAINEVFDPFQEKCRMLSCPVLNAPFYGSCRRIALETGLISFNTVYRLDPVWELSTLIWNDDRNTTLTKLGKEIYTVMNQKFGLLDDNCKSCLQTVAGSHQLQHIESINRDFPEYFVFSANFAADKNCLEKFIVQRLLALRGTTLIVKLDDQQMITFGTRSDTRSLSKIGRKTFIMFTDFQQCEAQHSVINLARAKVCPTIMLTNNDYFALINLTSTKSQRANVNALFGNAGAISFESSADLNKKTYVCLELYKNVIPGISEASIPKLPIQVWVMCVTTMYYTQR